MIDIPVKWFILMIIVCVLCNIMFVVWNVTSVHVQQPMVNHTPPVYTIARAPRLAYNHRIHVVVHIHRSSPRITADMIYRCFRSAFFPSHIHAHVLQELTPSDGHRADVYDLLRKREFMEPYLHNVHLWNENYKESSGPLVGMLSILENSVMPRAQCADDVVVTMPPFYHSYNTTVSKRGIYAPHFSRGWDDTLSWGFVDIPSAALSGKLPQSSLNGNTKLREYVYNTTHSLDEGVPTSTIHDLLMYQSNFTVASNYYKNAAPNQNNCYNMAKTDTPVSKVRYTQHSSALPQILVHNDWFTTNVDNIQKIVRCARRECAAQVKPIPYYAHNLLFSNLIYQAGIRLYTMNHLPVAVVIDHRLSSQQESDEGVDKTTQIIKNFRPVDWKLMHKHTDGSTDNTRDVIVYETSDRLQLIPLTNNFQLVSGIAPDNLTVDAFLGVSKYDTSHTIQAKFQSYEEYDRLKRIFKQTS